jgi:hypothetical protein
MLNEVFDIKDEQDNDDNYFQIKEIDPYVDGCEEKYYNLNDNYNYKLSGYWQNENFFKKYEDRIKKDFFLEEIKLEKSLIVQVRRGDFVNNKSHEYCDLNWYNIAISSIKKNSEIENVYITSDDLDWCKINFHHLENVKFMSGDLKNQFRYFYGCDNFVISNSSFGWWGSWYSNSENVICPKIWYPDDLRWNTARNKWRKQ